MKDYCISRFVYHESMKRESQTRPLYECRCDERLKTFVYYESLKRELKTKPIYEFRCDERLQTKVEEFTRLGCTVLNDKTNLFIMNR